MECEHYEIIRTAFKTTSKKKLNIKIIDFHKNTKNYHKQKFVASKNYEKDEMTLSRISG